jgi:SPW repeat
MTRLNQIRNQLDVHRSWEDWIIFGLGMALIVSPALDPAHAAPLVLLNTIVVGFLVMCLAMSELALVERWDEWANLVFGVWTMIAPVVLGYAGAGTLWLWQIVIGAAIVAVSALELWQDRPASQPSA